MGDLSCNAEEDMILDEQIEQEFVPEEVEKL